jgi:hypothetical protein
MSTRVLSLGVLAFLGAMPLSAQTPPCGRAIVAVTDDNLQTEERFLPEPPEHVKACTLRALPAVAAKLEKDEGLSLKAKIGRFGLWNTWLDTNKKAGVKGAMRGTVIGSFAIALRPNTRDGVSGTNVKIDFDKWGIGGSKKGATVLMEEIACLSGLLGHSDPRATPRGAIDASDPIEDRTVALPEGTPLKVILRDPLYSKNVDKKNKDTEIVFEVADDVTTDGVRLIGKGALGLGRFTEAATDAGRFGRSADLMFVVDYVTAVDGQSVAVTGAINRQSQRDIGAAQQSLLVGLLTKGLETVVRAGTGFDVEVSGTHTIRVGK